LSGFKTPKDYLPTLTAIFPGGPGLAATIVEILELRITGGGDDNWSGALTTKNVDGCKDVH